MKTLLLIVWIIFCLTFSNGCATTSQFEDMNLYEHNALPQWRLANDC